MIHDTGRAVMVMSFGDAASSKGSSQKFAEAHQTNKIRLGGGAWNENRTVGFTVRVL